MAHPSGPSNLTTVQPKPTVPEYLRRVNAALALRDIPENQAALGQLQQAATLAPADSTVHLLLGLTHQDLGNFQAADASLRRAVQLAPNSAEARQALATLLVQQAQYDEAIQLLKPVVQGTVHNVAIAQLMATALTKVNKIQAAVAVLEPVYEHAEADAELSGQFGHLLLELGRHDQASKVLERAVALRPTPDYLTDLAAAYTMLDRLPDAMALLEQARLQRPDYDRAWRGLAFSYLQLGRLDEALDAADHALQLNDQHFRNWQVKVDILFKLSRREEARAAIERGIELARQTPEGNTVLFNLIARRTTETLRTEGPQAAVIQLDQAFQERPDMLAFLQMKKDILVRYNQYEKALVALNQAVDNGLDARESALDYYLIYQGLNQPDEALAAIRPLLESPDDREETLQAMENAGVELYVRRQTPASRRVFEQLHELQPDRPRPLNNLGFILIGEGEWQQAETHIRRAIELGFESPAISLANLGYIALRQAQYADAVSTLREAELQTKPDESSILRVACWYEGSFSDTQYDQHPTRFASALAAIRANLATALYLTGQPDEALKTAEAAIEASPYDDPAYKVMGCLQLALGNVEAARAAWEQALKLHKTKAGKASIRTWLEKLPPRV